MEKNKYIEKWIEGTLTEEEKSVFEKTDEYQSLTKLSKSLNAFKAPEYDTAAELDQLKSKISSKKGKVIHFNWIQPLFKAAAVFVILAGVYLFFMQSSTVTIKTEAAQKTEIMLPDSSLIILNALSTISYNEKKWEKDRKVDLSGEAFFKVAKGSKFDVKTSSGTVSVLGTQFNVRDRDDYYEVICYEGLVRVQTEEHTTQLPKNHSVRLMHGKLSQESNITDALPSWTANISSFNSVPFIYVIREFERQYKSQVTTENVDTQQLFTGSFTHSDMSLALKSIAYPLNLDYTLSDTNEVLLTGDIE